ncbi:secretion protein [Bacterioplanes sanyensis]|uniref:Secretion protein n=1 Tax=Bacterioplanes sanyensis TaxID=1249553 RepID=A0A222FG76_9GAMM|nr:TolC family outer membrane protein [Bacterioplanes sanyensis]ASP37739.1 secretion protein [Bacterioplanes sanyensis]
MKKLLALSTAMLMAGMAHATDLSTIYQRAVANDAEVAAARATREANGYNVAIARGGLLPQAQFNYSKTKFDTESEQIDPVSGASADVDNDYTLDSLSIEASQALFDLNSWYTYQSARAGDDAAAHQLQLAEQDLLLRAAKAYFDVLRAQENLSTAQAEEKAVGRSLEQTKQRFEVGLIAVTEVLEAQATYDLTAVNLIGQEAALDISYEALEVLTGERYSDVAPLRDDVQMQMPAPANVGEWVSSGMEKYAGILLAQSNRESVRLQRNATRSNHLPTVKLVASYTDADQPSLADPTDSTSTAIGVQLSVPLLAGGSLYGQSKQAASQFAAADYQLESQRRQAKQNIRSLYRQVQTDVKNVKARKQAIASAESALEATETGYEVGTRNIVEVLDAQRNLFSAKRDYANARYDYIINLLNLKFYAGTLHEGDINELNGWLQNQA